MWLSVSTTGVRTRCGIEHSDHSSYCFLRSNLLKLPFKYLTFRAGSNSHALGQPGKQRWNEAPHSDFTAFSGCHQSSSGLCTDVHLCTDCKIHIRSSKQYHRGHEDQCGKVFRCHTAGTELLLLLHLVCECAVEFS